MDDMKRMRVRDLLVTFEPNGKLLLRSASSGRGARAHPFAAAVLAMCSTPCSRQEVVEQGGTSAGPLFDQLAASGFLLPADQAQDTPVMFANFAGLDVHRRMLADEGRIEAYRKAIGAIVRADDVVIDAGTGTGVLAVLAALAGARKVYAIEMTELANTARTVVHESGVADRVEVLQGDFRQLRLKEKARVLVTETFGAWAAAEGARFDLAECVQHNMQPDPVLIPNSYSQFLAPMATAPPELLQPFRKRDDGVDLSCLLAEARGRSATLAVASDMLGPAVPVGHHSLLGPDAQAPVAAHIEMAGPCAALCGWFTLHLAPGIDLSTSPWDAPTHWKQTVLPIALPSGICPLVVRQSMAPEDRRTLLVEFEGAVCQAVRVR